jgi:hypothetical protein
MRSSFIRVEPAGVQVS